MDPEVSKLLCMLRTKIIKYKIISRGNLGQTSDLVCPNLKQT
jgi:hypothetical protein